MPKCFVCLFYDLVLDDDMLSVVDMIILKVRNI